MSNYKLCCDFFYRVNQSTIFFSLENCNYTKRLPCTDCIIRLEYVKKVRVSLLFVVWCSFTTALSFRVEKSFFFFAFFTVKRMIYCTCLHCFLTSLRSCDDSVVYLHVTAFMLSLRKCL